MQRDFQLLKDVLSVPTVTYQEDLMIEFIINWLKENKIPFVVDIHWNIYATKQTGDIGPDFYFPCVVAHTDTVHELEEIHIKEMKLPNDQKEIKLALKAFNENGRPTGIGGDDKCGVFACMELLKEMDNIKAAFFVSEETGCLGSKHADLHFFEDVGYCIQFDAPGNSMVTEYCMGVKLFNREDDFFKTCDGVLKENFGERVKYQSHPYTDVYALKSKFDFSCINFAIGYYNYHTPNEYVVVEDVYNGIDAGKKMIERLGNKKYTYVPPKKGFTILS